MAHRKPTETLSFGPGIWGPVTATLDWCEANYQFSHYIAEMANSVSNIVAIALALHGAYKLYSQDLPARCVAGFLWFGLVGVGSFAFHATLLYGAQLADELPMIYSCSWSIFMLYDLSPGFDLQTSPNGKTVLALTLIFNVLFTWSYMVYRNPVYHQVVFAILMLSTAGRTSYLLRRQEARALSAGTVQTISRLYIDGTVLFLLGFGIWNLDNVFCDTVTKWKFGVRWPAAFLLEGHSWWHVLTAAGSYLMWTGTTYLTLCLKDKDDPTSYTLDYSLGYIPYVKKIKKCKSA